MGWQEQWWGIFPGCRRSNDSQGARSHWIQSTVTEKDSHSQKNQKDSACSHSHRKKNQHPNIKRLLLGCLSQSHCCANVTQTSTLLLHLFSHNMICGSLYMFGKCTPSPRSIHDTNHSIDRSRRQMKILPEKFSCDQ